MSKHSSPQLQELMMKRSEAYFASDGDFIWDAALVCPGLYVGSLRAALDIHYLTTHNVVAVLTVAGQLKVCLPDTFKHLQIDIADHAAADILEILPTAFHFLDEVLLPDGKSDRSVMVHCASGISRSVSVCCAWLMARKGMSLDSALETVRATRPVANPNVGFHRQLNVLASKLAIHPVVDAIELAREEYRVTLGGRSITESLIEGREAASELHSITDGRAVAPFLHTTAKLMLSTLYVQT
jgi:predicted protein tyrosine phosphatase